MHSVTGQLKVRLQLHVNEPTTFSQVCEMILLYDASTTNWSEQLVLGTDSAMSSNDGPVPMEIDRMEPKGRNKAAKGESKENPKKTWKKARKNLLTRKALMETSTHRMTDPRAKGKEIPKHVLFVGDRAVWPKIVGVQHR